MSLATIVPTYNEASNIRTLLESILKVYREVRIDGWVVVVDDNSPDGTARIAEEVGREHGYVVVINRPEKLGIGSAYRDGFRYVLENLKVRYVGGMDADGSHPPEELPRLLRAMEEGHADCVVASRYVGSGGWKGASVNRVVVSKVANALARLTSGLRLKDTTSGYRVYRVDALRSLDLDGLEEGYVFQVQILYELAKKGCKIIESPFVFMPRRYGRSKLKVIEIMRFISWCSGVLLKRACGQG